MDKRFYCLLTIRLVQRYLRIISNFNVLVGSLPLNKIITLVFYEYIMCLKNILWLTIILFIIIVLLFAYHNHNFPQENPILWYFFPDDTIYAPEFSESNFLKVRVGMNISQVIALLGVSLTISEYGGVSLNEVRELELKDNIYHVTYQSDEFSTSHIDEFVYFYSKHGLKYEDFHYRALLVSKEGFVKEIYRSFEID